MTRKQSGLSVPSSDFGRAAAQDLTALAVVAAVALTVALAARPIASYDVGYHLAYGDHFLRTGHIVRTNRFIYTKLDRDRLADPNELGPGCRYDAQTDTYHFVNANWLSQVVMAGVHGLGGMAALSVLQAALVAAIFAAVIVLMRSGGVSWHWIAPAVILIAMTSYERFDLRPEVFGYLVLVGQLALLLPARFGWRRACGVVALQLLAVNLHSYFLLGVALTGAMFVDALLRWLWARTVTQGGARELEVRLKWLAAAAGGTILASLCNPFFLRGAVMPIRTILYLKAHQIMGTRPALNSHPWAFVGEFVPTLDEGLRNTRATTAYVVVAALSCVAIAAAVSRRRWGPAMILAGMGAVSFLTRRNIALGAMILVPVSMIVLTEGCTWLVQRRPAGGRARLVRPAVIAVALITGALGVWWTVSVVTDRFYFSERRSWRFGLGASKVMIPLEAAKWINSHKPAGAVWCDFASSSNIMYLTRPHRDVPILTNTWAYPPYVMKRLMEITAGLPKAPFEPVAGRYNVGVVVLRYARQVPPLIGILARSPDWAVVQIGAKHVVFVAGGGPNAALARRCGITEERLNVPELVGRLSRADPVAPCALHSAALLLSSMGWTRAAIAVWQECVEAKDDYPEALFGLAGALAKQANTQARMARDYARANSPGEAEFARSLARENCRHAQRLLERLLRLRPDYPNAERSLEWVRSRLLRLQRQPGPPRP